MGRVDVNWEEVETTNERGEPEIGWERYDSRNYYIKDHLGSIRVVVDQYGQITSAQDYYPFGETLRTYTTGSGQNDKYKFTEKERDIETGYDYFGARFYDSRIGRWLSVDPLAEKRPGLSPYNYCQLNPINRFDPDGKIDDKAKKKAAQSVVISEGQRANQAATVRKNYVKAVSEVTTSAERTQLKLDARAKTPQPYLALAEQKHSMSNEAVKFGGTVNKSNAGVNATMETVGKVGKGLLVVGLGISAYNIATADNTTKAVVQEAGTWTGAIAGGQTGATIGAAIGVLFGGVGAVPGAIVGGLIGSVTGGFIGNQVAKEVYKKLDK